MAERSFAAEVQQLTVPEGTEFRGEGILAVTKALLECGVGYVAGYQGSPISHLMDVLADAQPILEDLGVHFEPSASEATAAATLSASVMYPIRGAVTWKSTVGTNVASDALANLASGGVTGGAVIIIGEDYGEGSSIMQERSHAFAMKSQIWLLDPRPNLPAITQAVHDAFELSEASRTPVMLQLRVRSCHVHGSFITRPNKRPDFSLKQALENPQRDTSRIVLPPAAYLHEHEKIMDRWPAAVKFIEERQLNEFFAGDLTDIGIVMLGGHYNNVQRALLAHDMADLFGNTRIPQYVMNVAYPVIDSEVLRFCEGKKAVLVIEEGQPEYHEQNLHTILGRAGVRTVIHGKDMLPRAGEYTVTELKKGLARFLERYHPAALAKPVAVAMPRPVAPKAVPQADGRLQIPFTSALAAASAAAPAQVGVTSLASVVPGRPSGFCVGCPERPIFSALTLAQDDLGTHHIAGDIGCHLFAALPPFNLGATTMGYGLGVSSAAAFNVEGSKRSIAIMGDGGFWHNGLSSGIGNAVFNQSDGVIVIVDNNYSAATGGQDILSSRAENPHRSTFHPIEAAVRGIGVQWVRTVDHTYDVKRMLATLKEAMTTDHKGPKVVIAQSECMLNKQRRVKPQVAAAVKRGERTLKEKFGVDANVCSGDHACMRVSGCPSLTLKPSGDPLKPDPVAHVDDGCVACGHCGEVADAAVLCPSFYRTEWVRNAGAWERRVHALRRRVVGWFQARQQRALAERALY
ncbi:indolepyruvate ferredoxin oxidoreductase subunit alpha [Hydrogenophaga sp. OTU3427]|uniref:indolepyruvate ferredoxin oxidoreductase subunit alpha n=1 Tax=Hydrogenophaga sp. OTU3427 TaxID=3043856 RepID=UPI00313DDA04